MLPGLWLSDDAWLIIIHLARHLDIKTIAAYTGCTRRTITHILTEYREHGTVAHNHLALQQGRRWVLTPGDIHVSESIYFELIKWLRHNWVSEGHCLSLSGHLSWWIAAGFGKTLWCSGQYQHNMEESLPQWVHNEKYHKVSIRTKWGTSSSILHSIWDTLYSSANYLCRWELLWSPHKHTQLGMGTSWQACLSEMLFCLWSTVHSHLIEQKPM